MRKIIILILVLLSFSKNHVVAEPRCEELWNKIYNDTIRKDVNLLSQNDVKTIGIRLEKIWENINPDDPLAGTWQLKTNNQGYFSVGKITKGNLSEEIKIGDIVISINDIDLRKLAEDRDKKKIIEENVSDLFEEDELIKFELMRKNKNSGKKEIFIVDRTYKEADEPNIKNTLESFDRPYIDLFVKSINVNEKDGTFDASIETSFMEYMNENWFLSRTIWNTIVYDKEYRDGKLKNYMYERCSFNEDKWGQLNSEDPYYGMVYHNIISEEKANRVSEYYLKPEITHNYYDEDIGEDEWEYFENESQIIYKSVSTIKFKNKFNLRTFPFDTQKLKIYLRNDRSDLYDFRSLVSTWTYKKALEFKLENSIQGWDINNFEMDYKIYDDPNDYVYKDGFELTFEIARKSGYYIFKIILPILLILSICWSSVWINPRELESRLTISIVCLLSLIAYNFVIDSDLPKLEYLTIMDYIILISYFYATIPNFLSIISFELIKKKKYKFLSLKIESLAKRYGMFSYILIIFIIIIINTSLNISNTNAMLSWIVPIF